MYCKNCGVKNPENAKFCQNCGGRIENVVVSNNVLINNVPINNEPMNNVQINNPLVNNLPNNGLIETQKKKGNPIFFLALIVFGICAITIPLFLGNKSQTTKEDNPIDQTSSSETTQVKYNGYTFDIPKEYYYTYYEENLMIYSDTASWAIMFFINDNNFTNYKLQLDSLKSSFAEDYDGVQVSLENYQGYEYILVEYISDGQEIQMIMLEFDSDKTILIGLATYNSDVSFDSLFNIAFPIAIGAK